MERNNYKKEIEEIREKNRIISDEQIETIISEDFLKVEERYVYKSQMLKEIRNEKEYLRNLLQMIQKKGVEAGIPIEYEEVKLSIPYSFNREDARLNKSQLEPFQVKSEKYLGNQWNGTAHSLAYLAQFVRKLQGIYQKMCEQEEGILKGEEGERTVERGLKLYEGKYHYRENVILPANDIGGETSETDVYIVTSKAIFVCEVKNWGQRGRTICISKDGLWYVKDREIVLKSPIQQNTRHCLATERYLKLHGVKDYKIIPLIIIANDEVKIENQGANNIIRMSELYNFIEGLNIPEKYTDQQQKEVLELFDSGRLPERKFKIMSISRKNKLIEHQIDEIFKWILDEKKRRQDACDYASRIKAKKEKKQEIVRVGILIASVAAIIALIVGISGISRKMNEPEEINLKKYIECQIEGYSGSGEVTSAVNKELLEDDIAYYANKKLSRNTETVSLEDLGININVEPKNGLSNGDIVKVSFSFNMPQTLKSNYPQIKFTGEEGKKIKVKGLKEKGGEGVIFDPAEISNNDIDKIKAGVQQEIMKREYKLVLGYPDYSVEKLYPIEEDEISNISIDNDMKFYNINTKFEKNNLLVSFELDIKMNSESGETYHCYGICKFQDLRMGKDGSVDMDDGLKNLLISDLNTEKEYVDMHVSDESEEYAVTYNE